MTKLTACRHCGYEVSKTAGTCPKCGGRSPAAMEVSNRTVAIVVACAITVSILIFLLGGLLSLLGAQ